MIESFLQSIPMFQQAYFTALLAGALLALVGVLVVAREQVFLGAAVSQASTLGVALALFFNLSQKLLPALGLALGAALVSGAPRRAGGASHEERTGWVFLTASSLSILLLAHQPHGLRAIQQVLASSLIGATAADVWMFGGLAAVVAAWFFAARRQLVLFVSDPVMAAAVGMRLGAWEWLTAALLGVSAGLAIYATGMLFTFGCLVLPALAAKNLCREIAPMFVVSPLVAVLAGVGGLVLANHYDLPPGQMIVALLCGVLALAWLWRAMRERMFE
jgi:ABC-type Mn2+/Zn2+ transport system permease subunit